MRRKLIILISLNLFSFGCTSKEETLHEERSLVPVSITSPQAKDITLYLESIGTLHPSVFMEIRSQTDGTLEEVLVKEGDWVEKGTPLFKIDPKLYRIKVQEAEAQLAMDLAELKRVQKKLERYRDLAKKDLMSQTEWDDLEAEKEKSEALVNLDQARLDSAKHDLDNCTLRAPALGRVGKLDAHPGQLVRSGQITPLGSLSTMDPLIVEFTMTEKEFPKIMKDSLQIELKPLFSSDPPKLGTVTFLDNHFDSKTGLLLIRGRVKNSDYSLKPGQSVRVRIPVTFIKNAKLIPEKTIRYNNQGPYVYVVKSDMTVEIRQITLGSEQGADQIVEEGLDPSETIILEGHLRLQPGLKVEIKS